YTAVVVIVSFAPIHPCGSLGTPQGVLVAMPLKKDKNQIFLYDKSVYNEINNKIKN
ncbi:MAG: hypothetical protein UR99_C0012G0001, partial [Candidatus Moranbacteria bacterium GW2011_GWD2_36_12]